MVVGKSDFSRIWYLPRRPTFELRYMFCKQILSFVDKIFDLNTGFFQRTFGNIALIIRIDYDSYRNEIIIFSVRNSGFMNVQDKRIIVGRLCSLVGFWTLSVAFFDSQLLEMFDIFSFSHARRSRLEGIFVVKTSDEVTSPEHQRTWNRFPVQVIELHHACFFHRNAFQDTFRVKEIYSSLINPYSITAKICVKFWV